MKQKTLILINQKSVLSKSCLDTYNANTINEMRQASHNEKKQVLKKCIG